jgi:hypothetical protein
MRILLALVALSSALWGGYWFVGSRALIHQVDAAQARAQAAGLAARFQAEVTGFPNRFDLTLNDLTLQDPASGVGWQAPFFQLFALSYQPHKMIAVWPHRQVVTTGVQEITVTSDDMRASFAVRAAAALPLDRVIFVAGNLTLAAGSQGATLRDLRLALRAVDDQPNTYDLGAEITGLRPDPAYLAPILARLPANQPLPDTIDTLHLEGFLALDRPLDRFAAQDAARNRALPEPRSLRVRNARLIWGDLDVTATGTLAVGPDGLLSGRIEMRATGWQVLVPLATAAGLIRPEIAPTYANALQVLADLSPPLDQVEVPLTLADGQMRLGPLPLGPAPRLR